MSLKTGLFFLLAITFCASLARSDDVWLKAQALKPGDTIAFAAPAGPVEMQPLTVYAQALEKEGFRVLIPANIDRKTDYLAGTDQERSNELNQLIRDPNVQAIFAARGGYGLTRILDDIDYESLRKFPKILCGYSDITALHLAVAKNAKLITFHSPMPMSNLWQSDAPKYLYASDSFKRTVFASGYKTQLLGFAIPLPKQNLCKTLVPGKSTGRLVGGNLSLVCATMGTPYGIEAAGRILFLEDVHEAPYRVDRLLSQLKLAGVLQEVKGVLLGDFSGKDANERADIDRVLVDYFGKLSVPVVMNFPVGHVPDNATLPFGALAELDAETQTLRLLEDPVHR